MASGSEQLDASAVRWLLLQYVAICAMQYQYTLYGQLTAPPSPRPPSAPS